MGCVLENTKLTSTFGAGIMQIISNVPLFITSLNVCGMQLGWLEA